MGRRDSDSEEEHPKPKRQKRFRFQTFEQRVADVSVHNCCSTLGSVGGACSRRRRTCRNCFAGGSHAYRLPLGALQSAG